MVNVDDHAHRLCDSKQQNPTSVSTSKINTDLICNNCFYICIHFLFPVLFLIIFSFHVQYNLFIVGVPHIITVLEKLENEVVMADVGDTITCSSKGCPTATYKWYIQNTSDVIEGAFLNITDDMVSYIQMKEQLLILNPFIVVFIE